eukprot:5979177-Prymnesium_polylepis.1
MLIKDMPDTFKSSQRCNAAWRSRLLRVGPALAKVLDGAASQLRARLEEEWGEGKAAGALCTS